MPRPRVFDRWLFLTASTLVLGGVLMVGSASNHIAMSFGMDPSAFYWKQALHMLLGFVAMLVAVSIPYHKLQSRGGILLFYFGCLAALIWVLTMPDVAGVRRWLLIGQFRFQPSEFAKLFVVLFMAFMLARKEEKVNELGSFLAPCMVVVGSLTGLIVSEDLGAAILITTLAGIMTFIGGLRLKYIGVAAGLGLVGLAAGVLIRPYRWTRIQSWATAWSDPSMDVLGSNYQLNQSLTAIGSGGIAGRGWGNGTGQALHVPASHTDFIFSVIGEELGMIGALALLVGFLLVLWRGLRTAGNAPDRFGFYLALGMTCLIVVQALVNMSVCLGLLPTKGLALPLISYGGSSLLASMAAMGLLLNISQHSN